MSTARNPPTSEKHTTSRLSNHAGFKETRPRAIYLPVMENKCGCLSCSSETLFTAAHLCMRERQCFMFCRWKCDLCRRSARRINCPKRAKAERLALPLALQVHAISRLPTHYHEESHLKMFRRLIPYHFSSSHSIPKYPLLQIVKDF